MYYICSSLSTSFDNPAAKAPSPARQLTLSYLIFVNARLLAYPFELLADYSMGAVALVESFSDPRNALTVGLFVLAPLLLVVSWRRAQSEKQRAFLLLSTCVLVVPFLPATNLFFTVGFVVAERVLYLPSVGWCLLVAKGAYTLRRRFLRGRLGNAAGIFALVLYVSALGLRTRLRSGDWTTERPLFLEALRITQGNAKCYSNVGHTYEGEGDHETALGYFYLATRVQSNDRGAWINVGNALRELGRLDEAVQVYQAVLDTFPVAEEGQILKVKMAAKDLNALVNLGNLMERNTSRYDEAEKLYRRLIAMRGDQPVGHMALADLLAKRGRVAEGVEALIEGTRRAPDAVDLQYRLGLAYIKAKAFKEAEAPLRKALELAPFADQVLSHLGLSLLMGANRARHAEGITLLERAFSLRKDPHYAFNLCVHYSKQSLWPEAHRWSTEAIKYGPGTPQFLLHHVKIMRNIQLNAEALPYLREVIALQPQMIEPLLHLGDIELHHTKEFEKSRAAYAKALELNASLWQVHNNYCASYLQERDLYAARQCYQRFRTRLPKDERDWHKRIVEFMGSIEKELEKFAQTKSK